MKYLVCGAGGFIGGHIVDELTGHAAQAAAEVGGGAPPTDGK